MASGSERAKSFCHKGLCLSQKHTKGGGHKAEHEWQRHPLCASSLTCIRLPPPVPALSATRHCERPPRAHHQHVSVDAPRTQTQALSGAAAAKTLSSMTCEEATSHPEHSPRHLGPNHSKQYLHASIIERHSPLSHLNPHFTIRTNTYFSRFFKNFCGLSGFLAPFCREQGPANGDSVLASPGTFRFSPIA